MLENPECERLCAAMHKMRFQGTKARQVCLTEEQASATRHRKQVHFFGSPIGKSAALIRTLQSHNSMQNTEVAMHWTITDTYGAIICVLALVGMFAATPTVPALIGLGLLLLLS